MKISKTIIFSLLFITFQSSFGQINTDTKQDQPYIEVTGIAEKKIVPDEIYIAITLKDRINGKEKRTVAEQEKELTDALQAIGISADQLALSDANADYVHIKWRKKDVISRTDYLLKVKDAITVGKVYEKLDQLKIEGAYVARVSHSNIETFRKEVKIEAIKAAKSKADYLLLAIGEWTGKALVVKETGYNNLARGNVNANTRLEEGQSYIRGSRPTKFFATNIQFKKIKLHASVYVKFAIKQDG